MARLRKAWMPVLIIAILAIGGMSWAGFGNAQGDAAAGGGGPGSDTTAIHDNVAGEVAALTLVTALGTDHVLIEDASDANNKKRVLVSDFLGGAAGTLAATLSAGNTTGNNTIEISGTSTGITSTAGAGAIGKALGIAAGAGDTTFAGGALNLTAGAGGVNGAGGALVIAAGAGGATSGTGGDVFFSAGASPTGTGGTTFILGATGLTNSGSIGITGGTGLGTGAPGVVAIQGGNAGTSGVGGVANMDGGRGGSTTGVGGQARVLGGIGGGNSNGGAATFTGGTGTGTGRGGHATIDGGAAGFTDGAGGNVELNAADGGGTLGNGGSVQINAGDGQTGGGTAGTVTIGGGQSRFSGIGGGNVTISGGFPTVGNAAGGAVSITASPAIGSGAGGAVNITAGTSPSGTDGRITLTSSGTAYPLTVAGSGPALTTTAQTIVEAINEIDAAGGGTWAQALTLGAASGASNPQIDTGQFILGQTGLDLRTTGTADLTLRTGVTARITIFGADGHVEMPQWLRVGGSATAVANAAGDFAAGDSVRFLHYDASLGGGTLRLDAGTNSFVVLNGAGYIEGHTETTVTNAAVTVSQTSLNSTGTTADGFGLQIRHQIEGAAAGQINAAILRTTWDSRAGLDAFYDIKVAGSGGGAGGADATTLALRCRGDDLVVEARGGLEVSGTAARILSGTGTPEATVTAAIGSLYMRTDGGAGTTLYVKESGVGNTGWVGK